MGTKTKSLSLLIDRSNDFNKRQEFNRNNNNSSNTFSNSFKSNTSNNQRGTYTMDDPRNNNYNNNMDDLRNYNMQQKRQPRRFYSFINNNNNNNNNNNQWERASADRDLSYGYHANPPGMGAARSLDREGLLRNYPESDIFCNSMHDEDLFSQPGVDNTPSPGYNSISKDAYVLEMQSQVMLLLSLL